MVIQIVTFYKFIELDRLTERRDELKGAMRELDIRGTVILAGEGFNSTVCGTPASVAVFLKRVETILNVSIDGKSSFHIERPFRRIEVKIKPEIVALKQNVDISLGDGTHMEPHEWNELISDPETIVLDARNEYEIMNGSFDRAVNPKTSRFSELPKFVQQNLDPDKHKKIAMYCTGGIRCEKFAPYLRSMGFENVFQLKGGILKYLESIPKSESLWHGECFVFDDRRTVDAELKKGVLPDHSQATAARNSSK